MGISVIADYIALSIKISLPIRTIMNYRHQMAVGHMILENFPIR